MPRFDRIRWQAVSPYLDKALEMSREDLARFLMSLRAEHPAIASDLEMLLDDREALGATSLSMTTSPVRWRRDWSPDGIAASTP